MSTEDILQMVNAKLNIHYNVCKIWPMFAALEEDKGTSVVMVKSM